MSTEPKRRRGRPKTGAAIPVRLSDAENEIARSMGIKGNPEKGVVSLGVRMALRAVYVLGVDRALELANRFPPSMLIEAGEAEPDGEGAPLGPDEEEA